MKYFRPQNMYLFTIPKINNSPYNIINLKSFFKKYNDNVCNNDYYKYSS